jgi:hypothetical protein
MPSVFINFHKTEMVFYLFDDEVDEKMAKKLSKLGLGDLSVEFPESKGDQYVKSEGGLFCSSVFEKGSFPVSAATESSQYSTKFNPENNSITVSLEGRFLCYNTLDEDQPHANQKIGYVWGIRLNNDKGKLIKKPKDQWGMSTPIVALAEKGAYGGGAHQVLFSIHIEEETFYA